MRRSRWRAANYPSRAARAWARRPRSTRQHTPHTPSQIGEQLFAKPWIVLEPRIVAPRGMRQGNITWRELAPSPYGFGHVLLLPRAQIAFQRVGTDEEGEREFRQGRKQWRMPERRAFFSRRQVVAVRVVAGKAETHTDDGDLFLVVKGFAIHAEPLAQAVARRIVEGQSRFMHAKARRLRDDAEIRAHAGADDGARLVRQVWRADAAGADFLEQTRELSCAVRHQSPRRRLRAMTSCWIWLVPS